MSKSSTRCALRLSRPNPFDVNRLVCRAELEPSAKVLLMVILGHAHHGRSTCTASTGTLAKESGLSPRHVQRLLVALAKDAWIELDRKTGSAHSRHIVKAGPKVHEVGQIGPCSRTNQVHEVGHGRPCKRSGRDPEKERGEIRAREGRENPGGRIRTHAEAVAILQARVDAARKNSAP